MILLLSSRALFLTSDLVLFFHFSANALRRTTDAERKLEEAKAKMKEGKRAAFQRKLEMIEAGESEEDEFPPKDSSLH